MPSLIVFAGPNGSGKSTLSTSILQTLGYPALAAFDWDAEFTRLFARFSYDPAVENGVRDAINDKFNSAFETALREKKDFAFETNFHAEIVMDIVEKARKQEYDVILIFLYMASVKDCEERVKSRVELGGHNVSKEDIQKRFNAGLSNLKSFYRQFEITYIFNTSKDWKTSLVLSISSGKIIQKEPGSTFEFFKKTLPGLAMEKDKGKDPGQEM